MPEGRSQARRGVSIRSAVTCGAIACLALASACGAPAGTASSGGPASRDIAEPSPVAEPSRETEPTQGPATPPPSTRGAPAGGCAADTDCEVAATLVDCCGTVQLVGVPRGARDAAEEAARTAHFGGSCECVAGPNQLEDGTPVEPTAALLAICDASRCVVRVAEHTEPTPSADAPVPCRTERDCWVTPYPAERPIVRPANIRHRFRPCEDGSVAPLCRAGVCAVGPRFGC